MTSETQIQEQIEMMKFKLDNLKDIEEKYKLMKKRMKHLLRLLGKTEYVQLGRELGYIKKEFGKDVK